MKHFINNLIFLHTKDFGMIFEKVIKEYMGYDKADDATHDGKYEGEKVEIKVSRAIEKIDKKEFDNLYEYVLNHKKRLLSKDELDKFEFDSNIQQIKPKLFDKLIYGLLTNDGLLLFKIKNDDILNEKKKLRYSDKQHRGNKDEGQFHISNKNINYHLDNFYFDIISMEKIVEILKSIK